MAGIVVCGLNGSGKSTLGRALAQRLGARFLDMEDLTFPEKAGADRFAAPRPPEEVQARLRAEIEKHEDFVLAAVTARLDPELLSRFFLAVRLEVPREIRLQRVRNRSLAQFGSRMLPGGDLYEQEQAFLSQIAGKSEQRVEDWVKALPCPVLRVDGTKEMEENLSWIVEQITEINKEGSKMIREEMARRALPPLFAENVTAQNFEAWRQRTVETYARECFGVTPPAPAQVRAQVEEDREDDWAGKAVHRKVLLSFEMERGAFSFPVHLVLPKAGRPLPCAVYISFTPYATAGYQPIEEIVDQGYALAVFCYEDVTRDNGDFADGIAALTARGAQDSWGKIGMWAYAASRVLDYLLAVPEIDGGRIFVMGHSRLGKTALWAAAQDARFAAAVSNDSGCSGAAVSRGKVGESVGAIYRQFPFWFCENYEKYGGREDALPFEQYQLLACIAPRPLYVASASEDEWADPASEFLSCALASPAYALFDRPGLLAPDALPQPGQRFAAGSIGYHLRPGTHYLSRYDWVRVMRFMDLHL